MLFRHAWALLFAPSLIGIGVAIPIILLGQPPPLGPEAGNVEEIAKLSAPLGDWVRNTWRIFGLSLLGFGVFGAVISAKPFRKGEMWAWYASWILPVFYVGTTIINPGATGAQAFLVVSLIGLLLAPQFESIVRREKKSS